MNIINDLKRIALEEGFKVAIEIFLDTFSKDSKEYQEAVRKSKAFEKHYQSLEYSIRTKDFRFGRITRNTFDITLKLIEGVIK